MAKEVDLDGVSRREGRMPSLGGLRQKAAADAHEVRLAEARARGDQGRVALGIFQPRVHDREIGRAELREAERVRDEVVHERRA